MHPDWISLPEARDTVVGAMRPLAVERLPLPDALGRVLAEEIVSPLDLPPWDNSAMDGYATRAADVAGASVDDPRVLRVVDDIPAGSFPSRRVEPGTASRVMTGAPVPEGADGVIRVEHTLGGDTPAAPEFVRIVSDFDAGKNLRRRGEDLRRGERAMEVGRVLRAAEIGVAASLGRDRLAVVRRPVVGVLASGDELVDIERFDEVLAGRRIVSSNGYALAAQLAESGLHARLLGIAADDPASLREHLERARGCDALITTAGISVGAHDYVRDVLLDMGLETEFWRVRMRPGSPFAFGRIGSLGDLPWFGLPGNPVSCMVTFELFVRPALLRMAGHRDVYLPTVNPQLRTDFPQRAGLTQVVRVTLAADAGGEVTAALTGPQGSGILTSMAAADGLMVIPEDREGARAGERFPTMVLHGAPLRGAPGY